MKVKRWILCVQASEILSGISNRQGLKTSLFLLLSGAALGKKDFQTHTSAVSSMKAPHHWSQFINQESVSINHAHTWASVECRREKYHLLVFLLTCHRWVSNFANFLMLIVVIKTHPLFLCWERKVMSCNRILYLFVQL